MAIRVLALIALLLSAPAQAVEVAGLKLADAEGALVLKGAGLRITLNRQPSTGTRVTVDGKPMGAAIPGEDFYRALLRIWLGERPVQDDLKGALLGGKQ